MTVKAILSHKGTGVITIAPTARLFDAVKVLDEHQIGAVVITDTDQQVVGILSERDVVRTLAHNIRKRRLPALRRTSWSGDDAQSRDLHTG